MIFIASEPISNDNVEITYFVGLINLNNEIPTTKQHLKYEPVLAVVDKSFNQSEAKNSHAQP